MNIENQKFRLKSTWEFVDKQHSFYIPSYQRGYRWDTKQVEDLLRDLLSFSNADITGSPFYCLQPIVVKRKIWEYGGAEYDGWEVIDGQQRLTTLLLLLIYLVEKVSDAEDYKNSLYQIFYQTRPGLDFKNVNAKQDIDSYYVDNAKKVIAKWFIDNKSHIRGSALVEALLKNTKTPQVKFIWYEVEDDNDIASIRVFNNLNKGKIKLTNCELIKALFILRAKNPLNGDENLDISEIAYVWNDIECSLQNDKLWYFLSNPAERYSTRIDLIFDFLTEKNHSPDDDFSYRKFQQLFDSRFSEDRYWKDLGVMNFTQAWNKTKEIFLTFSYWFEDNTLYHYIGYLIEIGVPLKEIYDMCRDTDKNETISKLRSMIKIRISPERNLIISELDYDNKLTKYILLLFNIESYLMQNNLSGGAYNRFPFDLYKTNSWDVEHVVSQTENPLIDYKDKIVWLSFVPMLNCCEQTKQRAIELKDKIEQHKRDESGNFAGIYKDVLSEVQSDAPIETDNISNLALLDAGTNRGYGNALFPTKRQEIIKKDKSGGFIPLCTKNMFLKYYSDKEDSDSQWKNSWTKDDATAYLRAIETALSWINK